MSRKEKINGILDDYLTQRNKSKSSISSYLKSRKRRKELEKENKLLDQGIKPENIDPDKIRPERQQPEPEAEPFLNLDNVELEVKKEKEAGMFSRIKQRFKREKKEEDIPPLTEEDLSSFSFDDEEGEVKPGFLTRLFRKKKKEFSEEVPTTISKEEHPVVGDMVQLSKAITQIFNSLPPDQIRNIKNMPEFDEFKEILKKHEIIK